MSRWVRIQADVFEHDVFAREPFTEAQAWIWLISKAAWKDTKHRIGHNVVDVPTGSVFLTLREMQATWRWRSDKRVRSFLSMLEREEMIETKTDAGKTQVSICNYSRYQEAGRTEDAAGTQAGRTADALKTPVHQYTNKKTNGASAPERDYFSEFWISYPRREGPNPKKPAEVIFLRLVAKGADPESIIAAARKLASENPTPTRFIPQAQTWLNQERFADSEPVIPGDLFCAEDGQTTRLHVIRFRNENDGHDPPRAVQGGKAGYLIPAQWVKSMELRQANG